MVQLILLRWLECLSEEESSGFPHSTSSGDAAATPRPVELLHARGEPERRGEPARPPWGSSTSAMSGQGSRQAGARDDSRGCTTVDGTSIAVEDGTRKEI